MLPHTTSSLEHISGTGQAESMPSDRVPAPVRAPKRPAAAVGALALGALAVGAFAIGAVAIGRIVVGRARIRRLEIGDLVVGTLRITTKLDMPPTD